MKDFITGLQFLTRFRLVRQNEENWDEYAFARSVKWFPLVGAVIGLCLAGANYLLAPYIDIFLRAALLVFLEIFITGGILCDGLMDTADGVFSGRPRERMLEIMKDSCVGANGVIAFVLLVLFKLAFYQAISAEFLTVVLFAMPVVTRLAIVLAITHFNYARKEGIGGLFCKGITKKAAYWAFLLAFILLFATNSLPLYLATILCLFYALAAATYLKRILGGLTGDTYGFIAETANVVFLLLTYISSLVLNNCTGGFLF